MNDIGYRSIGLIVAVCGCALGCATVPPAAAPPPVPPPTSATAGTTTIVAIAPPTPAPNPNCTIWDFLGVKMLIKDIGMCATCAFNILESQFPSLAAGLPSAAMGMPLSPDSPNPAVAAAANAKAEEAAAPQKIKALRYLGSLGCGGCHPEVEKALLAALDDCTEVVRFEAVSVLADTSRCRCRYCDSGRCCSVAVRQKLLKTAAEVNDDGCYVETSARVRRMARVALCNCGCDPWEIEPELPRPTEGPSSEGTPPPPAPAMAHKHRRDRRSDVASKASTLKPKAEIRDLDEEARDQQAKKVEKSDIKTVDFDSESSKDAEVAETKPTTAEKPQTNNGPLTAADLISKSGAVVNKPYDKSRRSPDVIIKTADPQAKTNAVQKALVPARPTTAGLVPDRSVDVTSVRVRWERAAVPISRFESKEAALATMDYLRKQALGEMPSTFPDANLKHVTTREVGWTRPQDIHSPELAKALFELSVGEISPVVEVGDVLLFCRVLERDEPGVPVPPE